MSKITPEIRATIIDWDRQRRALGTQKTIAHRLNLSTNAVERIIAESRAARYAAGHGECPKSAVAEKRASGQAPERRR